MYVVVIKITPSSKQCFNFSPIFYGGIECQLFMLMTFFYSSRDLTCMLGSLF